MSWLLLVPLREHNADGSGRVKRNRGLESLPQLWPPADAQEKCHLGIEAKKNSTNLKPGRKSYLLSYYSPPVPSSPTLMPSRIQQRNLRNEVYRVTALASQSRVKKEDTELRDNK